MITRIKKTTTDLNYIVSTVKIADFYETMVFFDEDEVYVSRCDTKKQAIKQHSDCVERYSINTENLEKAIQEAQMLADMYIDYNDGGTCVMDWIEVRLNKKTNTKKISHMYKNIHKIHISACGQANRYAKMIAVAAEYLKSEGYPVSINYVMD